MSAPACDQTEIGQAIEENILALLDTAGVREAEDIEDDKMSFLEAVHALSIAPEVAKAPTRRVYEAIFRILEENRSLVLNTAGYLLLTELNERYPPVTVKATSDPRRAPKEIIIDNKIWSPFNISPDANEKSNRTEQLTRSGTLETSDHESFITLMETIASQLDMEPISPHDSILDKQCGNDSKISEANQAVGIVLKFKYLVSVLERDFKCRVEVFKATSNMEVLTSSFLMQIAKGSRKKAFVTALLRLIAASVSSLEFKSDLNENVEEVCSFEESKDLNYARIRAEVMELNDFHLSIQSLLQMIIYFDVEYTKKVNASPRKLRQDVQRVSILDLITDIVGYEKTLLSPLLQGMSDPDCKLKVIFNYFMKNAPQPIVRDMRDKLDKTTVQDLLHCFVQSKDAKSIYRSMETDVLQLLLATAFKAKVLKQVLSKQHRCDGEIDADILATCKLLIDAFENLQNISSDFELHSTAKQALICAEALAIVAK